MNSYGSVSLVRQAIYKILRYMNFFSPPPPTSTTTNNASGGDANSDDDIRITLPPTPSIEDPKCIGSDDEPKEKKEKCTMCTILNISN